MQGVLRVLNRNDDAYIKQLTDNIFAGLAQKNIDYPYSAYNAKRIEDLILCVRTAVAAQGEIAPEQLVPYVAEAASRAKARLPEPKELTQLNAVVDHLARLAESTGSKSDLKLWLPELPTRLLLSDIAASFGSADGALRVDGRERWSLSAVVGFVDDPVNQSQFPMVVDFERDGNVAVCGMSTTGKSTFVQTLLYALCSKYTPDDVNFYILDFSNKMLQAFEYAPHVGDVITEDSVDDLGKFFVMMEKELARRKRLFRGGSYSQYIRANGKKEPAIICVIDGYGNFREKTENAFDSQIKSLTLNGVNYGIFLVLASGGFGAGDMQNFLLDNIKAVYCLELGDKFKYSEALRSMHIDALPEPNIKGRGLAVFNKAALEFQTALCVDSEDDFSRSEAITKELNALRAAWSGRRARPIPRIPTSPTWDQFSEADGFEELIRSSEFLPVGYNEYDASVCALDLRKVFSFIVAGKPRSGKTGALRTLMMSAQKKGAELLLFDTAAGELAEFAKGIGAKVCVSDDEYVEGATTLMKLAAERNKRKQELKTARLEKDELFAAMAKDFTAQFVFIADMHDFATRIYAAKARDITPFIENLLDKGEFHNIFVFAAINTSDAVRIKENRALSLMVARRTGMLVGCNASDQKLLDFSSLSFKEQARSRKPGEALIPSSVAGSVVSVTMPNTRA